MKKIAFLGCLILYLSLPQAFAQQRLNDTVLLKRLQEVNGHITDMRIKLGEALLGHLDNQDDYMQIESMKNIYRIASEYQTFGDCEERVLFLYTHINEKVKVYISAILHNSLKKDTKNWDESIKNFQKYLGHLTDENTIIAVTQLQRRIEEAQDLMNQLIIYYASENAKHRR